MVTCVIIWIKYFYDVIITSGYVITEEYFFFVMDYKSARCGALLQVFVWEVIIF